MIILEKKLSLQLRRIQRDYEKYKEILNSQNDGNLTAIESSQLSRQKVYYDGLCDGLQIAINYAKKYK